MLKINVAELMTLMKDFYVLTGIKMALFDEHSTQICAYPTDNKNFCSYMKNNDSFRRCCDKDDKNAFEKCKKTKSISIYKCHAGLIEAVAPILENNIIIGYMMFGQIRDDKDKASFISNICEIFPTFSDNAAFINYVKKIKYKKIEQITAASKILESFANYVLLKNLVTQSNDEIKSRIVTYINNHITEDISIYELCDNFNLSRTHLYELMKPSMPNGIAHYIKAQRLNYAKKLIETTDLPIYSVSEKSGFCDYNYFIRIFRTHFGIPPKKLRQLKKHT